MNRELTAVRRFLLSFLFTVSGSPFCAAVDQGDAYVDASIGDASVLNPLLSGDSASNDIIAQVFNGLIRYNKNLEIEPELAESFEVRRGGLDIFFRLRRNVRWHDGAPFTAEDVVFTFQMLIQPGVHSPHSSSYSDVRDVVALDPYTVRVRYKQPFSPGLGSWGMGIIPRHIFSTGDLNTHPANRHPIGTGPYRFKEWKTDRYILLEANPDYFEGAPNIQRYIYRIIPDQSVQFLELRNQSIDTMALTPDQFKAYEDIFEHHQRYRYPAFSYVYMGLNLKNPLFADRRVRQALALAMDRDQLVTGLTLGLGHRLSGPYAIRSWAYNQRVEPWPYDPERARRLLKEAGWSTGADGRLVKDSRPFAFTLMTNQGNKIRALCAEVIQQQLKRLGISVEVRIIEWSTFLREYIDKKSFDAVVMGWNTGLDPDNFSIWHSSQQGPGQYNFVSYANPEVDRLLVEGRRTFDLKKRAAIYHRLHALIAEDVPYVFLYCPDNLVAIHKRFVGPEVAPAGIGWNFRQWWVPKARQRYAVERIP